MYQCIQVSFLYKGLSTLLSVLLILINSLLKKQINQSNIQINIHFIFIINIHIHIQSIIDTRREKKRKKSLRKNVSIQVKIWQRIKVELQIYFHLSKKYFGWVKIGFGFLFYFCLRKNIMKPISCITKKCLNSN